MQTERIPKPDLSPHLTWAEVDAVEIDLEPRMENVVSLPVGGRLSRPTPGDRLPSIFRRDLCEEHIQLIEAFLSESSHNR